MTKRELFEAWASKNNYSLTLGLFGGYLYAETKAAWQAWQAACPDGWQVVPKTVTAEMNDAYASDAYDTAQQCHDAVLAAAPQPGENQ